MTDRHTDVEGSKGSEGTWGRGLTKRVRRTRESRGGPRAPLLPLERRRTLGTPKGAFLFAPFCSCHFESNLLQDGNSVMGGRELHILEERLPRA